LRRCQSAETYGVTVGTYGVTVAVAVLVTVETAEVAQGEAVAQDVGIGAASEEVTVPEPETVVGGTPPMQ
jgi:hypothetical protein